MEHGTYVCVVVAHICKNKTFVPTVVIFKKVAVQNMCLRARTLETRPPFLSVPRFASKTARKKTRNVPARSSSSHSTPTSAKSFVIALPLILRSPPCFTREKPTVFSRTSTSSLRKKRSRLGNCILSPEKKIINCYQQASRATQVC